MIVFFGTPAFAVPSLKALINSGENISMVITQTDKPKGRGHIMSQPAVKEFALLHGIKVLQPLKLKDKDFIDGLKSISPEFIVASAYGRMLPTAVLDIPRIAPINVHASILPKLRGASPIAWAIINGERETGVTTMLMSKGIDEGDILLQEKAEIGDTDTMETLSEKLSIIGAELLIKTIKGMRDGSVKPIAQTGEPSYAPPLKKQDGRIDWSKTARGVFNFIRGMHPWPGAYCKIGSEQVTILKADVLEGRGSQGTIETLTKDSLIIGTSDGLISILLLRPEAKKPMSVKAFLQGRQLNKGMVIQ